MAVICPAVLADTPQDFMADLKRVSGFTKRIQIDIADGHFADNETVNLAQIYWPDDLLADLHMMVERPDEWEHDYISLKPNLVIIHAEAAEGQKSKFKLFEELKSVKIKTGLALLPQSSPAEFKQLIKAVDHVLIFAGELGHYGGHLDETQLAKISQVKTINPKLEVGVDGGINAENAAKVVAAGADVLNVGGFIQKSKNPQEAYATIERIANR